jgi:multidrug efflux pump subunit AcrA (membrane-fusion protein)
MKNHKSIFHKALLVLRLHKTATGIIAAALIIGSYGIYRSALTAGAVPQYTLSLVRLGTITQTVTGSGQVSASNQTDILSQVSGTIKSIKASVGQTVHAGDIIAAIDPANAAISLENARISLAKLTQPAKATDLSNAQNALEKSYNDGFNAAATIYLDLPDIMTGMKDMLYGQSGFLNDQTLLYLSSASKDARDIAGVAYDKAAVKYQISLQEFKGLTRSSATSSIDAMMSNTYDTIKAVSEAVTYAQNAVSRIKTYESGYSASAASTAAANVNAWASKANTDLGNLVAAQDGISGNMNSLSNLISGSDPLDVRSAQLNLEQAQKTYDDYFIRAPYDGVIGRIPVNVFGQAGSGTVIATIIGQQKIASISLNEVDAAKVRTGQDVKISFDAIDGLNATGTISVVDQIGTVSNGVVAYAVKVAISTDDPRIKPGMSVNTTIITKELDDVTVVPSSAIKTQGAIKYVQTLDPSLLNSFTGSSTRRLMTVSTANKPIMIKVTAGDSDDTNTEIISGLNLGQFVITKTAAAGSTQTATAPSLFSSLGARTPGAGSGVRVTGAAGAMRTGN